MYDVLIRNALIVDGTGAPPIPGDVAIKDDTIATIGDVPADAKRVIDARGLYLAPGFIDVHCHADFTVLDDSNPRDFKLRQGITTEVGGNCGETAAPVHPDRLDLLKAFVAFESPAQGVLSWEWRTFAEYLDTLSQHEIPTNFVPLVGHGTVRIAAMGFDIRDPSPAELDQMRSYVQEAMDAGAFGISVGLAYAPGAYAGTPEVIELAKVAARNGGLYATHMRNYADGVLEALGESFEVGRQAQIPVVISHIITPRTGTANLTESALAAMERAREEGLDVTTDIFTSAGTTLRVLLPHWVSEGSLDDLYRRLEDLAVRHRITAEMSGGSVDEMGSPSAKRWNDIFVSRVMTSTNKPLEGMSIRQISEERGIDPSEVVMDLVLEEQCQVSMYGPYGVEEDFRTALAHPLTMLETDAMGYCDGKPPPGQYGTYPRILGQYVRNEKLISLEEAIRKMTSYPARTMGLSRKGVVRKGVDADLVLFDLDRVRDTSTMEEPLGYPEGIEYVLVNGQVVVEGGQYNGVKVGRVMRRER